MELRQLPAGTEKKLALISVLASPLVSKMTPTLGAIVFQVIGCSLTFPVA